MRLAAEDAASKTTISRLKTVVEALSMQSARMIQEGEVDVDTNFAHCNARPSLEKWRRLRSAFRLVLLRSSNPRMLQQSCFGNSLQLASKLAISIKDKMTLPLSSAPSLATRKISKAKLAQQNFIQKQQMRIRNQMQMTALNTQWRCAELIRWITIDSLSDWITSISLPSSVHASKAPLLSSTSTSIPILYISDKAKIIASSNASETRQQIKKQKLSTSHLSATTPQAFTDLEFESIGSFQPQARIVVCSCLTDNDGCNHNLLKLRGGAKHIRWQVLHSALAERCAYVYTIFSGGKAKIRQLSCFESTLKQIKQRSTVVAGAAAAALKALERQLKSKSTVKAKISAAAKKALLNAAWQKMASANANANVAAAAASYVPTSLVTNSFAEGVIILEYITCVSLNVCWATSVGAVSNRDRDAFKTLLVCPIFVPIDQHVVYLQLLHALCFNFAHQEDLSHLWKIVFMTPGTNIDPPPSHWHLLRPPIGGQLSSTVKSALYTKLEKMCSTCEEVCKEKIHKIFIGFVISLHRNSRARHLDIYNVL